MTFHRAHAEDAKSRANSFQSCRFCAHIFQRPLSDPPKCLHINVSKQYVHRVIGDAAADPSALGEHFGAGLHAREVAWLMDHEWARTAEDVLWRRTKLGLRIDAAGVRRLDAWMQARRSARLAA